eukprot:scaffold7176_cov145-Amphora_coffeaeformis.AAC.8
MDQFTNDVIEAGTQSPTRDNGGSYTGRGFKMQRPTSSGPIKGATHSIGICGFANGIDQYQSIVVVVVVVFVGDQG